MKTLFTSLFLISSLSAFSQQVTIDATKHLQTIEGEERDHRTCYQRTAQKPGSLMV